MNRFFVFGAIAWLLLLASSHSQNTLLVDPAGGTPLLTSSTDDDDVASGRPLSFDFKFFNGDAHSTVDVAINGNLNFSKDTDFFNRSMPSADTARISPLWDDFEINTLLGDSIVEKVNPGVYYSVTWTVHTRLNPLSRHVFQVVLFGQAARIGTWSFRAGDIAFSYQTVGATFDKGSATVGLDSGDGEMFATMPDLLAAGGEAKNQYGPRLLALNGGQWLFRPTADGSYALPLLTNHPPVGVDDAGYGSGVITIPVLENDTDADGDQLVLDSTTQGATGKVAANPDGTVTYTPGTKFTGTDQFTYSLFDGLGGTATGTVRIMPFAVANGAYDGPLVLPPDPSADPGTPPDEQGHLKISVKDGGAFDAAINFDDGTNFAFQGKFGAGGRYSGTVNSTDGDGNPISCQVALVLDFLKNANQVSGTIISGADTLLLVAPRSVNSPPEAHDDLFYLSSRGNLVMKVLANDTDPDGDELTITAFTQGQSGSVTRSADGKSLTYLPNRPGGATDHLSYTVADPMGLTSIGQITVLTVASTGGSYLGLLTDSDPASGTLDPEGSGQLRLSVTTKGAFTAALTYGGNRYTMRGTFNSAGDFAGMLVLPGNVGLSLHLHLDLTQDSGQVTGTLSDADGTMISQIAAGRSRYRARVFPAPQAGAYTMLPTTDESGNPAAFSYMRIVVSATGVVAAKGRLGDNSPFSASSQLQMDGTVPFYVSRPVRGIKRTGFVLGALQFANPLARSDLGGHLTSWLPSSDPEVAAAPALETDLTGAVFAPPPAGTPIVSVPVASLNLEIDLNGQAIAATLAGNNHVTVDPQDPSKLTLVIQPKTGLFTGSFKEDVTLDSGKEVLIKRVFSGIFLRQQNRGGGVFVDSQGPGTITIVPAPNGD